MERRRRSKKIRNHELGFTLLAVISLMSLFMISFGVYGAITRSELGAFVQQRNSLQGFYASEGGLNLRAQAVKSLLTSSQLSGTSLRGTAPRTGDNTVSCSNDNMGSGDFACQKNLIGERQVHTYLTQPSGPPRWEPVPPGERFEGLHSFVTKHSIFSEARNSRSNALEARLRLDLAIRSVPLFQFAAFFANDLDVHNGPRMSLNGPVYTNMDLYLSAIDGLDIQGQVIAAGNIYRGQTFNNYCSHLGAVRVADMLGVLQALPACQAPRYQLTQADIAPWQGRIRMQTPPVEVPSTASLGVGGEFWRAADLRLVLKLRKNGANAGLPDTSANNRLAIEVQDANGNRRQDATNLLEQCNGSVTSLYLADPAANGQAFYDVSTGGANPGLLFGNDADTTNKAVGVSNTFFDIRENRGSDLDDSSPPLQSSTILEIDARALLACIQRGLDLDGDGSPGPNPISLLDHYRSLDDDTDGGLVIYATIDGPRSALPQSFYGVRVRNGLRLASDWPGSPEIKGLSFISDHMLYSVGSYNAPADPTQWRPAAFMADAYTAISDSWCSPSIWSTPAAWDPQTCDRRSVTNNGYNFGLRQPVPGSTLSIQAAILAGHDDFRTMGRQSGGLHNFMRYMENHMGAGSRHSYRGSMVSLGAPRHTGGRFQDAGGGRYQVYTPPVRDYQFDTRFTVRTNLPPATPELTFASQSLFDRTFDR